MLVNCRITKQLYNDPVSGFKILSCKPKNKPKGLVLSQYGTFTINGNNLSGLSINQEVELDIVSSYSPKYPESYRVVGLGGIKPDGEKIDVDPNQEINILSGVMTASQAKNVNEAYPNFVSMILNGQEGKIDYKKIHGVGKKYLTSYIQKVKSAYHYIRFIPIIAKYGIDDINIAQKLSILYDSPSELNEDMRLHPYHVFIDVLDMSFTKADKLIVKNRTQFIDSPERCEYACIHCLKKKETLGNTKILANELASLVYDIAPETLNKIVDTVSNSKRIHYDASSKQIGLEATYQAEQLIADNIQYRLENPTITSMKWQDYIEVDGLKLTDEQQSILQVVQENNVMILTGSAGCVDCDTEFFNGYTWKRIADYQDGDKVLQYNDDGTAELVEPLAYIKAPCDTLWHFETRHGVSQTVCQSHRIIYKTRDNVLKECNIDELKKMHLPKNKNFQGRFITTFDYEKEGIELSENEIRLMCAVMADSHLQNENTGYCVFHLKKKRKINRLTELFKKNKIDYKLKINKETGYYNFYANIPNAEKHFSKKWYNCSKEQMKVILDEICYWDGSLRKTKYGTEYKTYFTSVKSDADFVQFIASCCGIKSQIRIEDKIGEIHVIKNKEYVRKSLCYTVSFSKRNLPGLCSDNRVKCTKTPIEKYKTTDGYKYCFTVPSGMLILRNNNKICVTGNCGKTASIKSLTRMLEENGYSYELLAPTGIAARKMKENTGSQAYTIHSFLLKESKDNDFLLIDEASMIGVELLAMLLGSIPKETKIIFICDPSQLPSISCGNIVHDILESHKVPNVNLTKIFRYNSSGLITVATDTRMGNPCSFTNQYSDYKFIEELSEPVKQVIDEYEKLLSQGYNKNDILILSPYNKGTAGTYAINQAIQSKFNPNPLLDASYKRDSTTIQFAIGDRVINKKNNYNVPMLAMGAMGYEETDKSMFVANGSIGVILAEYREDDQACFAIQFDDGIGKFKGPEIANLLLGYAVSIHASQGNQARAVIVIVSKEHKRMVQRNLLYVGFTRAQEHLTVIGNKEAIEDGMKVEETAIRNTWLGDMLKGDKNK